MMRSPRTALGIDISHGRISLALLKRTAKGGVKLVKSASGTVPDGAIKDGNVENPALLASAIKKLKASKGIYSQNAAMSLIANPALVQILDLPEDRPSNVRRFVIDEVKHYAVLPMKHVAVDFRGINIPGKAGERRILVAATDERRVVDTGLALDKKGLSLKAIEPGWLAYIRACYEKKISGEFDTNLLFAVVHNDTITLCLFRNETLDFVRTKRIDPGGSGSAGYFDWLGDEINAIVKFYDFEVSGKSNKWKVILAADNRDGSLQEHLEQLRSKLDAAELALAPLGEAYVGTPIAKTPRCCEPSVVAVGLAMKLLGLGGCDLGINLLPPQVVEARAIQKQVLVIANVAALIFLLMVLVVGFLNMRVEKVNERIVEKTKTIAGKDIPALKDEQTALQEEWVRISSMVEELNAAAGTTESVKWARILDEIGFATPQDVQISGLSSNDSSKISLRGLARSQEAICLFIDTLNDSNRIGTASLVRAERDGQADGLVRYSINCSLIP